MIIDAHIHLFTPAIVANVAGRAGLVARLHLQSDAAGRRLGIPDLQSAMARAGVSLALNLPTAKAAGVAEANRKALDTSQRFDFLKTAGTLHPEMENISKELNNLHAAGVRAIKLSSFSQGFSPNGPPAFDMFAQIERFNRRCGHHFCVILDTFCAADAHFGSSPDHITYPRDLWRLADIFKGICFVGAHMGGLSAPPEMLLNHLKPAPNLYLDTSNAAHTLPPGVFVQLLQRHGPEHVLFGTDWPWFDPRDELALIAGLLDRAAFSPVDHHKVFGGNISGLLGI
jgi:predicted TIM-barrel fold metal-dependent hydrolase